MKQQEIEKYYDNFRGKLIQDFLRPNIRIENAIKSSLAKIPFDTKSILDLGFGLGWSTYEFARAFPDSKVEGYDISEELTKAATAIFNLPNLLYTSLDLTSNFPSGKFDVIVMLDVFEHIPLLARAKFYGHIKESLTENGRVIFTCPTVYHQNYLREFKPEGLQPVDEYVDLEVIKEFAIGTNTNICHFEFLDIWNKRDYLFCVIEREYGYQHRKPDVYLESIEVLNFYEKYNMILKAGISKSRLPKLALKQQLKCAVFKILK